MADNNVVASLIGKISEFAEGAVEQGRFSSESFWLHSLLSFSTRENGCI